MKNKEIIDKMTLKEKAVFLSGKGEWQAWRLFCLLLFYLLYHKTTSSENLFIK